MEGAREFKSMLSMGNSKRGSTESNVILLHEILREALIALNGEQQNGGMGYMYDKQSGREAKQIIESAVKDIAMALTGCEIRFIRK